MFFFSTSVSDHSANFFIFNLGTGEHGVGIGKREYLVEELGEGTVQFMRMIKKAVDPLGLFNPGKVSELFVAFLILNSQLHYISYTQTYQSQKRKNSPRPFINFGQACSTSPENTEEMLKCTSNI